MLLHRRKIAIIVQQRMPTFDAEGPDDDICGLADREAELPQLAIVAGGSGGEIGVQKWHESISTQFAFNARGVSVVTSALQNLEQDEVTDQERLSRGRCFQLGRRRSSKAPQVRDPNRAVDKDHCWTGGRP